MSVNQQLTCLVTNQRLVENHHVTEFKRVDVDLERLAGQHPITHALRDS